MKIILAFLSIFIVMGCIFDDNHKTDEKTGIVNLSLLIEKNNNALAKSSAASDTAFKLDTILVRISSPGLTDSLDRIITTARADTGAITIPTKSYVLKALHVYKFKIVTIDTLLNPSRRDTVHVDSIIDVSVFPSAVTNTSKVLVPRFSVLRVLMKSDSTSFIPNKFTACRIKVDGVVRDSAVLSTKTFSQVLVYRYVTPSVSHTIVLQAFDNVGKTRGFEKTFTVITQIGRDTLITDSVMVRTNTTQNGSTVTTVKIDTASSTVNNMYRGMKIRITSGAAIGQTRTCKSSVGSTKVLKIYPAWTITPGNNSGYIIYHKNLLTYCGTAGFPSCTP